MPEDRRPCAPVRRRGLTLAVFLKASRCGGAPVPGGRPNAEPGGGRASGAAQRRRLDLSTAQFGNGDALVVVTLRAGELLAVGVFDGFPGLASLGQVGEVLAAGLVEGWPVREPEVRHGHIGPVCGEHGPRQGVGRELGD